MTHLAPLLFALAAVLAIASLYGDARRFIRALADLARYIQEH